MGAPTHDDDKMPAVADGTFALAVMQVMVFSALTAVHGCWQQWRG
jgi:hypothetical protein